MRMSLLQSFNQGLRSMLRVESQQAQTQNQISTGRRVLQPSDDPLAAARILQLEREQSRLDQFQRNIDGVESSLMLQDTHLDAVETLLVRVRELAVQAGGGGLSQAERQGLSAELETRLEELVNLANSRNPMGEYVFGGYQGSQPPFVVATDGSGLHQYRGDDGQRLVQVASSTRVATGDSGQQIFVSIPAARLEGRSDPANSGAASLGSGRIVDASAHRAGHQGSFQIRLLEPEDPDNPEAPLRYEVLPLHADGSTGEAVASGIAVSGEPIVIQGVETHLYGEGVAGDQFVLRPAGNQNVLDTVAQLARAVGGLSDSAEDKQRLADAIANGLDQLDAAEAHISGSRTRIGARLNTLDSTRELHSASALVHEEVLKDIRDLDYAEAITRLTMESFVLDAARQSFAKISGMSLFNFMR